MNTTQKNVLSKFKGTEITRNAALVKPKVGDGTRANMTYFALPNQFFAICHKSNSLSIKLIQFQHVLQVSNESIKNFSIHDEFTLSAEVSTAT